jgi:FkbM family methyltransferase
MTRALRRLPRPFRALLRGVLHYLQRLGRWIIILRQIRGAGWRDELRLLASALAAPATALRGLTGWQDPILLFDARVVLKDVGTFEVRRLTDDLWHVLPWREHGIFRAMRTLLRPGDILVDAGANIGVYTLLASRLVGPAGRVIAIEMMPDTAAILRRHVRENGCGNVEIVERALSDRTDDIVVARVPAGRHGQASIALRETPGAQVAHREVRTITLDDACRGIDRIRLMKLDLEGAELGALAGGRSALTRTELVIFESHTAGSALTALFEKAGFDASQSLGKDRLARRLAAGRGKSASSKRR